MFQSGKGETYFNVETLVQTCIHDQSFIKMCQTRASIPSKKFPYCPSPKNQVYGRLVSKNFRTLNVVNSLCTVKFCLDFLHFSFFWFSIFWQNTSKKQQKHHKILYVRNFFLKTGQIFLPEIQNSTCFEGGVPQLSGATLNYQT